jgi:hypothetical protein
MHEINGEVYLSFREAREQIPGRPDIATMYRWATRDVNPLPTELVVGRRFVRKSALAEWLQQCAANDPLRPRRRTRTSRERDRAQDRAKKQLQAAGVKMK